MIPIAIVTYRLGGRGCFDGHFGKYFVELALVIRHSDSALGARAAHRVEL